jgi:hypothetical protein
MQYCPCNFPVVGWHRVHGKGRVGISKALWIAIQGFDYEIGCLFVEILCGNQYNLGADGLYALGLLRIGAGFDGRSVSAPDWTEPSQRYPYR